MNSKFKPKVSVIIPNYNHARYLRQRIETVLHQTYRDFEAILMDDCSTDESRAICLEYASDARVRIEFNEKNSGSTFKQWNKGVGLARGEYVWIAESDDYADDHFLEQLVLRLDADRSTVLSYCRSWRVSGDGNLVGFADQYSTDLDSQRWTADFLSDGREECEMYLVHRNTIPSASSVVFRKDVYEKVGGADERLVFCGDWKTWASMALTGGRIAYVGQPLNYFRFHDMTVTARSERFGLDADEYTQVIRWILRRVTPTEATRQKLGRDLFPFWHPKVLTNRTPLIRRWRILTNAWAIDPHAVRKLLKPALIALRMTISRRCRSI